MSADGTQATNDPPFWCRCGDGSDIHWTDEQKPHAVDARCHAPGCHCQQLRARLHDDKPRLRT